MRNGLVLAWVWMAVLLGGCLSGGPAGDAANEGGFGRGDDVAGVTDDGNAPGGVDLVDDVGGGGDGGADASGGSDDDGLDDDGSGDGASGAGDGGSGGGDGDSGAGEDEPTDAADVTDEVLALVNEERAERGLAALVRSAELDAAALRHADDMRANDFFAHAGSDGSSVGTRATDAGYAWSLVGENIAWGYPDAAAVMDGWMNSDGHRANILNAGFREIGIATDDNGAVLWVQVFGTPR